MARSSVISVSGIRTLDREAVAAGVPGQVLMEIAGFQAFQRLGQFHPLGAVTVLAGKGNNAGDAFVVARYLASAQRPCRVFALLDPSAYTGDAAINAALLESFGLEFTCLSDADALSSAIAGASVVVDGLLGTGLSGDVRPPLASVIDAVNVSPTPVLSLDLPSGLCGDTGRVLGTAVRADHTVTFGALKPGLLEGSGLTHAGIVSVAPLPYPPGAWANAR